MQTRKKIKQMHTALLQVPLTDSSSVVFSLLISNFGKTGIGCNPEPVIFSADIIPCQCSLVRMCLEKQLQPLTLRVPSSHHSAAFVESHWIFVARLLSHSVKVILLALNKYRNIIV